MKAKERFNKYAEQIEDAQTEIRKIIVMAFLLSIPFFSLNRLIKNIVVEYTDNIKIPNLKDGAVRGLIAFANRQNAEIRKIGLKPKTVKFIADNKDKRFPNKPTENVIKDLEMPPVSDMGVPIKQYYQEVFKTKIEPILDRLCEQVALDPNDLTGRNSLRNFAEMEVRYNDHLEQIEELKNSGAKIAVSSAHADCSDRCAPWQGRLYSLDGTSGKIDGKEYVPLEKATDIYYTTKAGKVYKNGLLGFNCFDDRTEVFTRKGWKLFKDVTANDYVFTINPKTKKTEWQKPIAFFNEPYEGDMIYFKYLGFELCVTPNHSMLFAKNGIKSFYFKPAEAAEKCDRFITVAAMDFTKPQIIDTPIQKTCEKYKGTIHCLTVPNHTLLVARDGFVVWCGNCRHYLEKYEGKMLPTISADERKKEYAITTEQRRLERLVRRERIRAVTLNGIDNKGYQEAKKRAAELYSMYKKYSIEHDRAYYPMRVKV